MATGEKHGREQIDAIEMLKDDHKDVNALFKKFAALKNDADSDADEEKMAVVRKICDALTVHTTLEEEIFYPAVREAIGDADLMDEALVEHAGAKDLVAQLRDMDAADDLFDAKVTVLGEQIAHHVKEEEGDMFPKAKKAKVDTQEVGTEMAARRQELMSEMESEAVPKEKGSGKRPQAGR